MIRLSKHRRLIYGQSTQSDLESGADFGSDFQILLVLAVISVVVAVSAFITGLVRGKMPGFGLDASGLTAADLSVYTQGTSAPWLEVPKLLLGTAFSALSVVLLGFIFYQGKRIFSEILEAQTPFLKTTGKRLKSIAVVLGALGTVVPILYGIFGIWLMQEGAIGINMVTCFFAFVIYALAVIFDYGQILQSQADETL